MSLNPLAAALLLPPVNLVPLGLAGMILAQRRPRLGRALGAAALLGLLVLGMPVVSLSLMASLQSGIPRDVPVQAGPAGAIVVLSAEGSGDGAGGILPRHGLGSLTLERMQAGVVLARRLSLPLLVTGGVVEHGGPPIAEAMDRTLRADFGMAAGWVEPRADDTWENAQYSAAMLEASGVRTVYLVTSAWHMRRALMAFRHTGITAIPVASRFAPDPHVKLGEFIPRVTGWGGSYLAMHEWLGCLYYALRGWAQRG